MRGSDRQSEFPAAHDPFHGRRGDKARSLQARWWARACAAFVLCAAAAIGSRAQTFKTLHSFQGGDLGAYPEANLIQGTDGSLYGTTSGFGNGGNYGTVFKVSRSGTLTTLHAFEFTDGAYPWAGLVQGIDGGLFGTTSGGGTTGNYGTVFKVTPDGTLHSLYSFCSAPGCADGEEPYAGLVAGIGGTLYGTTEAGGVEGGGTVFAVAAAGALATVSSFCIQGDCPYGSYPEAGLVLDPDGNLYGTATEGGFGDRGTMFGLTLSGAFRTLYNFCSQGDCADGGIPYAGLVLGSDGDLYGTTTEGGAYGTGTVFKITRTGAFTTLYSFCSQPGCTDGKYPYATLVQATDGNFYGTTTQGGANGGQVGDGTAFKISPAGVLTTLYSFCSQPDCADGKLPNGGLVQDTDGVFYGTTSSGGSSNYGTIFGLSVGLGPFVETQPAFGPVGRSVKILGTNLTGATSVTLNGTAATFTVVSPSLITTTVPADATTGTVQVVTPGGTLSSNVPFRVIP